MTYMIELTPKPTHSFSGLAYDQHRIILADLISEGLVLNYAESESRDKFWIMMEAFSQDEAIDILSDLPTLKHFKISVIPLYTFEANFKFEMVYSLN